jgi:hypothetical protein
MGLDPARGLLADAADWLAPEGRLLLELTADQAGQLTAEADGWRAEVLTDADVTTVIVALSIAQGNGNVGSPPPKTTLSFP